MTFRYTIRRQAIQYVRAYNGIVQIVTQCTSTNTGHDDNHIRGRGTTTNRNIYNRHFNNALRQTKSHRLRTRHATILPNRLQYFPDPRPSLYYSHTRRHIVLLYPNRLTIRHLFRPNGTTTFYVRVTSRVLTRQGFYTTPYHYGTTCTTPKGITIRFRRGQYKTITIPMRGYLPNAVHGYVRTYMIIFTQRTRNGVPHFRPNRGRTTIVMGTTPPNERQRPSHILHFNPNDVNVILYRGVRTTRGCHGPRRGDYVRHRCPFTKRLLAPF